MMLNEFEVRSYGWQELAVLYGPSGFDAGIGRETVVQMGGGQSGAKGGAAG